MTEENATPIEETPKEPSLPPVKEDDLSNLDRIMDVPLVVSVELGRTSVQISDLLQLAQGSIVELTKLAGEPLDVLVHGKLVARGEAVVINDQFGVRLTDIVSHSERIETLGAD
ncbi:MAG: flagellar motor switch protein FliN [Deltaproteobacteria bacterium]